MSEVGPYARDRLVDKPGIVGARWWHESLVDQAAQMARRDAIRNILIAGGLIAAFGGMLTMCIKAEMTTPTGTSPASTPGPLGTLSDDYTSKRQTSLAMQKAYGWSFGAVGEPLVFDGVTTKPFEPGALHSLATDLSPAQQRLLRYYQSTLFDSPEAVPTSLSTLDSSEAANFQPLAGSVKPTHTPAMDGAYAHGKTLAELFASVSSPNAVVVDLPGPEAVAFAAGAASAFDPVFLFDNWPHPRGVVRAQETLSAAAYYQPLFFTARGKVTLQTAPRMPMFVLDRRRLTPYTDDATQFDNRYLAKLPLTGAELSALGAKHVLYIAPAGTHMPYELDDLNDDFVVYGAGGIDLRVLTLDLFTSDAGSGVQVIAYTPVGRVTPYSVGSPNPNARSQAVPTSFATVPVVLAVGTGIILGSQYSRNGSWNRSGGSWGGG